MREGTFLSLGCGLQSSALYLMACEGTLRIDAAIFADTQQEPPWVYRTLAYLQAQGGPPIDVVSAGDLGKAILDALGRKHIERVSNPPFYVKQTFAYPTTPIGYAVQDDLFGAPGQLVAYPMGDDRGGMLWRSCTRDYKARVIDQHIKRRYLGIAKGHRVPKGTCVVQYHGISWDERGRRGASREHWIDIQYPLCDWRMSREDLPPWLTARGHPVFEKSACGFCPHRSDAEWARIKAEHPEVFDAACEFDERLRAGRKLPGVMGDVYVHRSFTPLRDARLKVYDQLSMFDAECAGYCGV